jgi:monoamine oxidase
MTSIVVVGAGLAGATAALRLAQAGVFVDVLEANPTRVGGRTWSAHFKERYFNGPEIDGQKYERGGEAIDGNHIELKQLVQEMGLNLTNMYQAEIKGTEVIYNVSDGSGRQYNYPPNSVKKDVQAIWQTLKDDVHAAGFPTLYDSFTQTGRELDNTALSQYIADVCARAGLSNNALNQILNVAETTEFGLDTPIQSTLNMLYLIGYHGPGKVRFFGQNSEKTTVTEGNDQVSKRALERYTQLSGKDVLMGHRLDKLTRLSSGKYSLSITVLNSDGSVSGTKSLIYDRVIMATPFFVMRPDKMSPNAIETGNTEDGVDSQFKWHTNVADASFCLKKRQAIIGLNPAQSSKLMVQFNTRFWSDSTNNCNGEIFATNVVNGKETMFQNTWDTTRGQPGTKGILTNFTGGTYAVETTHTKGVDRDVDVEIQVNDFLTKLSTVLTGVQANINRDESGKIISNYDCKNWMDEQYARGAYSSYSTGDEAGQPTSFVGIEPRAEPNDEPDVLKRNCHFCGEHTSFEFLGFMNGGVSSGNRVAAEVLDVLKKLK